MCAECAAHSHVNNEDSNRNNTHRGQGTSPLTPIIQQRAAALGHNIWGQGWQQGQRSHQAQRVAVRGVLELRPWIDLHRRAHVHGGTSKVPACNSKGERERRKGTVKRWQWDGGMPGLGPRHKFGNQLPIPPNGKLSLTIARSAP